MDLIAFSMRYWLSKVSCGVDWLHTFIKRNYDKDYEWYEIAHINNRYNDNDIYDN